jgi:hypothetical protein
MNPPWVYLSVCLTLILHYFTVVVSVEITVSQQRRIGWQWWLYASQPSGSFANLLPVYLEPGNQYNI